MINLYNLRTPGAHMATRDLAQRMRLADPLAFEDLRERAQQYVDDPRPAHAERLAAQLIVALQALRVVNITIGDET